MILAHHGGELPLVLATLVGAVPPLMVVARARVSAATARLRRRPRIDRR